MNYETLSKFKSEFDISKSWLMKRLEASRFEVDGLLLERGHRPPVRVFDVRDPLAVKLAELIGQPVEKVREFYVKAA